MAAKHAGMAEDAYKTELARRLAESVHEVLEAQETCPECGKPVTKLTTKKSKKA